MDIYTRKKKWKFVLISFAITIGVSSLFVTNMLVRELKTEERKKIELWAAATKQLVSLTGEGDYSLAVKVISENNNIPLILVDEVDSILENRNLNIDNKSSSSLRKELNIMKEQHEPVEVNIIGNKQWIYYKDSDMLFHLRYLQD